MILDVVIPRRPVSHQCKDSQSMRMWKDYVYGYVFREWGVRPIANTNFKFTVVYLCDEDPPDINNIIKPIEDVFCGLVYPDDSDVIDIAGHTRYFDDGLDITELPTKLIEAVYNGQECVYVKIDIVQPEEIHL